jgi:hypothetical protein
MRTVMALMMRRVRVDWNRRIRQEENNTHEDSDGSGDEEVYLLGYT